MKNSNLAHVQFVLHIPNLMKTLNHRITVSLRILIRRSQIMIFADTFFARVHTVFLDEKHYSGKNAIHVHIFFFLKDVGFGRVFRLPRPAAKVN